MSSRCMIDNCKTTLNNKTPAINLHPCPTNPELRNKWVKALRSKCTSVDWAKSRICSKHFELKYFDSQRNLKDHAIPSLFTPNPRLQGDLQGKSKVERLLNKMTQAKLQLDIKNSLARLREPSNLDVFVNDELRCKPDAPMEAKLWLMVKKQDHLNTRLVDLVTQTKNHVEILQNKMEESKEIKKQQEVTIEHLKYVVKCLQEKQVTLEEQVEILTAVESR